MPTFLAPLFLMAAAAAVIPIALHLLWRHRPKPVPFSTLRFLQAACIQTRRARQVTQFLILLLRVLILLLLAFAFARPKFLLREGASGKRTVLAFIDCSASLQYRQNDRTSFELARERAERLLASLGETDKGALLGLGLAEPRLVFPPSSDRIRLLERVRDANAGFGRVNLVRSLADVLDHIPASMDRRGLEIHIFSDFQESAWPSSELKGIGDRLKRDDDVVFLNVVRPAVIENEGIVKVEVFPPVLVGAGDIQAETTVRATTDFTRKNNLSLLIDGKPQDLASVQAVPGSARKELLRGKVGDGLGPVPGRLELGNDAFSLDNVCYFALQRMAGLPVALVGAATVPGSLVGETFFLQAAVQPGGKTRNWFVPKLQTWEEFMAREPEGVTIFFLCNPPAFNEVLVRKIETITAGGGTVILFPGNANTLLQPHPDIPFLKDIVSTDHAVPKGEATQLMGSRKPTNLEKRVRSILPMTPTFTVRRRLAMTLRSPELQPLLEYPDGTPFMVEVPAGKGRVWVVSLSPDRGWSDWPVTPLFLVLQQELLRDLAGRAQPSLSTLIGATLALPWTAAALEADFDLRTPDGRTQRLSLSRREATEPFLIAKFDTPGIYQLYQGDDTRMIAVNLDPEESDLTFPDPAKLTAPLAPAKVFVTQTWREQEDAIRLARTGRPIWPHLLTAAFLLAVLENFMSNWRARSPDARQAAWLARLMFWKR